MNEDVEKAILHRDCGFMNDMEWKTIKQALRDQEAEIEKLREKADKFMWQVRGTCVRAEKAEALLRSMRNGAFNIGGWASDIDEYFTHEN